MAKDTRLERCPYANPAEHYAEISDDPSPIRTWISRPGSRSSGLLWADFLCFWALWWRELVRIERQISWYEWFHPILEEQSGMSTKGASSWMTTT